MSIPVLEPERPQPAPRAGLLTLVLGVLRFARGRRWPVAVIGAALLLESAFTAFVPVAFGRLIDHTIPQRDGRDLWLILGILAAGALLVSAVGVVRDYLYAKVQSGILREIRVAMFGHLQRLSLSWFGRTHPGDVLSRFSADLGTVDSALMAAPPWVLLPAVDVVLSTAVLFWLDWRLALVAMLIWPACLLGPRAFANRATQASDDRKQQEADTLGLVHESVAAQPTMRLFLLTGDAMRRFAVRADRLAHASVRVAFFGAMVERSAGIGISVLRVVVLGVGAVMAFRGMITVGTLAGFQAVFLSLSSALSWIVQYVPTLLQASGSIRRVHDLLDTEPETAAADGQASLPPLSRALDVRRLSFDYGMGHSAGGGGLRDVSLTIPAGASAAVVGPSGSGKSTLLALLLRLQHPTAGRILMDGTDIRTASVASLREQIGVVSQESFLFSASLRENIRVGRLGATDDEVEAAARAAEIHDFIMMLPDRYDTLVGEGGMRLSGGQRQRIAIARALVRDPRILVLDEATSALDASTEAAVNDTLRRMSAGRTVISVTHRLSSVVHADHVFVLELGRLVEQGTHESLLAAGGIYRTLWDKQHSFVVADDLGGGRVEITPERLRRIPVLSRLDDQTLEELAPWFVEEQTPVGHVLVYEGDVADKFFILLRGRVEVSRRGDDGEPIIVAVLDDGDHFGETGLLRDVPRNATVTALTECRFLVLDSDRFRRVIARAPELHAELLRSMQARVSFTTPALPLRVVPEPEPR